MAKKVITKNVITNTLREPMYGELGVYYNEEEYEKRLVEFGKKVASGLLKTKYDNTGAKVFEQARTSMRWDYKDYLYDISFADEVEDGHLYKAKAVIISESWDIVQTAILKYLELVSGKFELPENYRFTEKFEFPISSLNWEDSVWSCQKIDKRRKIQDEELSENWQDCKLSCKDMIYISVREAISKLSDHDDSSYEWEDILRASDEGVVGSISYAKLSASEQAVEDTMELAKRLNLTSRQYQVVELRVRGYGYRAIASHLGVTPNGVLELLEQVQRKAMNEMDLPQKLLDKLFAELNAEVPDRDNPDYKTAKGIAYCYYKLKKEQAENSKKSKNSKKRRMSKKQLKSLLAEKSDK